MASANYPYIATSVSLPDGSYGIDVTFKGDTHPLPSLNEPGKARLSFYSKRIADNLAAELTHSRKRIATYFPVLR